MGRGGFSGISFYEYNEDRFWNLLHRTCYDGGFFIGKCIAW